MGDDINPADRIVFGIGDGLARTDALSVRGEIIYDTSFRDFAAEVVDALSDYETVKIYDHATRQHLTVYPAQLDDRKPVLRQLNRILEAHGIKPARFPRRGRR
jgi:hypothetical protein